MADVKASRSERLKGSISTLIHKALEESSFTRIWFVGMAVVAFSLSLLMPIGCMSPATNTFALFSINPHVLAFRYNAMVKNMTNTHLYDEERLKDDLRALPDVYRFGISGVCKEFTGNKEVHCTNRFIHSLDIDAVIKQDIAKASLSNATATNLQLFWDLWAHNMTENTSASKAHRDSLIHAAAGLTVTSLVIGPIGLVVAIAAYLLSHSSRKTIAIGIALFDASLMVTAAALWTTASAQYAAAFETSLGGQTVSNQPVWNSTPQYPSSYGLLLFACAALAKLCVLPIFALLFLVVLPIMLVVVALISIWFAFLLMKCLSNCMDACPTTTTTTTYYGSAYGSGWGGDSGGDS
ncbi:hypothetical protein AOQ84DRAFT_381906 [Glonium stellatum]|uniref:Uncharacterized protein n=1 Tax=Glonium stellatum TaxID=574774 RepID=A0A8E2EQY2_9PEZI|nr:hypothetical protein AOQ84DRAFT_381906 [Glonium stellatum]